MTLGLLLLFLGFHRFLADGVVPQADLSTLRYVQAVWRHGDRTPSVLIPTDTANGITTWQDGLGELTIKGEQQQYKLGKLLRARYDGFLNKKYSPFEIYVRSSDYNRTLASAQANLIGLYPPEDSELFDKGLRWRPIPVHTLPKKEDRELFDRVYCPHAETEETIVYSSPAVKQIEAENRAFLELVGTQTGYSKGALPLREMWKVFDPLMAEHSHPEEHQLPSWVNETVRKEIWRLYDISSAHLYGSPLLRRLRTGPLFAGILGRIEDVINGLRDEREKFYAYSAHDTAVAAILEAFGYTPDIFPEYATMALIELHKINNSNVVKLFYKNHTFADDVYEVPIPSCPDSCTVDRLKEVTRDVVPANWDEECGIYQVGGKKDIHLYAGATVVVLLMLILIAFWIKAYRSRLTNDYPSKYELLKQPADIDF